jgi:4-carboxymuconolactone decarboxylase
LRYRSTLPRPLNELAILVTARHWTQQYEWNLHHAEGLKAGLSPAIANAVADGRHPEAMSEDEEIVYEFCTELLQNHSVSDRAYGRAIAKFAEQGAIELVGLVGYYTFQSMVLNTARTPLPADAKPGLVAFPR